MKNMRLFFFVFVLNLWSITGCQKSDVFGTHGNSFLDGQEFGVGGACGSMTALECEMLVVVNEYRVSQNVPPLKSLNACIQMARDHAIDMVQRNFYSHNSPTETYGQRVSRYAVGSPVGENIAQGSDNVTTIFNMWKNSPAHNSNMLNSGYAHLGVGYYQGFWVQCFSGL